MTIIAETLDASSFSAAEAQAETISAAATQTISSNQFVYFAAFDGTNNDRNNVWMSGNPLSTNVAALQEQIILANPPGSNVVSNYFAGPGTGGVLDPSKVFPTEKIIEIANDAYNDFAKQATRWLANNPGSEVTAAFAAFSRGVAVAAVFSQLLYERGLVDPQTGRMLIPPGRIGISAGIALEPVGTGVAGNMAFAENVKNVVVVRAENEYRDFFEPMDYADQPGVITLLMMGNHCDIGGGYDLGLGALTLLAATRMLRASGIPINDVPPERQFTAGQGVIHDEAFEMVLNYDTGLFEQRRIWGSYGSVAQRTQRLIDEGRTITGATTQVNPDGSQVSTFTNYQGQLVVTTKSKTADGGTRTHNELKSASTGANIKESYVDTSADGLTVTVSTRDLLGQWRQTVTTRSPFDDGSSLVQIRYADGTSLVAVYDTAQKLSSQDVTTVQSNGGELTVHSVRVNGQLAETYRTTVMTDNEGSRIVGTQYADGHWNKTVFTSDGTLFQREASTPLGSQAERYDANGNVTVSILRQGDDDGNVLEITTLADGSGTVIALNSAGQLLNESTFTRTDEAGVPSIDGSQFSINSDVNGCVVTIAAEGGMAAGGDMAGSIHVTGISSIGGVLLASAGDLTAEDLVAFGFTFTDLASGTLPPSVNGLIGSLDPAAVTANGWAAPAVAETTIPQGFERRFELGNGWTSVSQYDSDRRLMGVMETYSPSGFEVHTRSFQVNADGSRTLLAQDSRMIGSDGSYVGTETDVTTRQVFRVSGDADGNTTRVLDIGGTNALGMSETATVFSDVNGFVGAIRSGQPIPILASGIRLLNAMSTTSGIQNANLSAANNVAAGVLSFYNLYNAFNSGNDFARVNSTLATINYANESLRVAGVGSAELSTLLNGSPLSAGGSVGVLPVLGLVASIQAEDPIGAAMNIGLMWEGAPFLSTPVGWALIAASILKAVLSDDGPPDAWGVAKVTFGEGFTNVDPLVQSSGENFGPDRVRQQLQGVVDVITQIIVNNNQSTNDSSQHLGLIPQRMPGLTFRASEFQDKGYAVTDIDPLTAAQRIPMLRFDDNGQPFGFLPEQLTAEERAMLTLSGTNASPLVAYMLNSAMDRGAIAPMWEVRTAKMQEQAGDPNAGLNEEERAAKAGYPAPVDSRYAASHATDPQASNRRQGHFMAVGLDLSGDGRIDTRTISQIEAGGQTITFDWDGQGYQKETGWIGAGDAFLVLDHDFNQSADNAKELLSNPLIADPGKGLRVLAAYDANGDGRIDASDPVYAQLKVWQDLDQDGNNIHAISVNAVSSLAQDESGGLKELRSLAESGITAIDYANGRFEMGDGNYRLIATQTLEAEDEGTRYTPVGAGIKIQVSNGAPHIVVTQVQGEQAVYEGLQIAASGETIGVPGAELYEDGVPTAYDPQTQDGPIELVISTAQLLQNDTWAGEAGAQAGLALTSVRAGAHTSVSLLPDGNISLRLEANYNGAAEFYYTVAVAGYESLIAPKEARVGLNITPVNDAPTVSNSLSSDRPIYGYAPLAYSYSYSTGSGEDATYETISGAVPGTPIYEPYIEHVPEQPIYEWQWVGSGEDRYQQQVQVGTTAAHDVAHDTVIATDRPNSGRVVATDADGGSFTFQILTQAAYGTASVDADGNWSYLGRRPQDYHIRDVTGDGQRDWVDPASGDIENAYTGDPNVDSNAYIGDENESFADYFTVRVYDSSDPSGQTFRDMQLQATRYGPAPLPIVSDSGGKKPIAIDLDGDGFHFTDVDDSNVFFEVNGEGWKRRMAWTEPGDGLLAYDKNGDGKIERSDEISFVSYAPGQQTDMAALRDAFDTNGNGRFEAGDAQWGSFGVWHDANSNGVTDPGEFRSLGDMGITSIDLGTDGQFRVIDGQTVHGIGSATLANGGSLAVADVTLRYTNETQVVTTDPDGSTRTSVVLQPSGAPGQDFEGTADKDLVFGTRGSDRFRMAAGDDVVIDDGGNDVVDAGGGDDQVFTGIDNDVVYGGDGNDSIYTGAGSDLVFGDGAGETGNDLIMLEDGNDIAFGGFGNDFVSGGLGNDVLSGNAGDDKLFGEDGWDVLFGQEGDDELYGMDGDDMLDGGDGNDLLAGGAGVDSMEGGAGNDTYQVDSAGDTVVEAAGNGNDTVESSITYALGDEVENLRLVGGTALSGTGNAAGNLLVGNDRDNTLAGLAGDDTLDGGLGGDAMAGGTGDDLYFVESSGDAVIEAAGEGMDTVRSRITTILAENVENLTLVGISAIDGTGNALDNLLAGNTAGNVLDGGAGADVMRGGRGNDTYRVDSVGDVVIEQSAEGTDRVIASVSYGLAANVEQLELVGAAATGTGNDLDNVMTGNALANVLDGGSGADVMAGGAGDDTYVVDNAGDVTLENAGDGEDTVMASIDQALAANVETLVLTGTAVAGTGNGLANVLQGNAQDNVLDGGEGADRMSGAAGDDMFIVDHASDVVVESTGEGTDTVFASVSYATGANVENLTLTGDADLSATGNALVNALTGNVGDNVLDGAGGADVLAGGAGDDGYLVDNEGDLVVEQAGEGSDSVIASVSYGLSANVENLALTGTAIHGTGNDLGNILVGNSRANMLDGGRGADRMSGQAGDDIYLVDDEGDTLIERAGEGNDTAISSVNYTLSDQVENLTLVGSADLDGTGNMLDNALQGNAGANVLDGATGADQMSGGAGDDIYLVDEAADQVIEQAGGGNDTVIAGVTYGLSDNVENLMLAGTADIDGFGNTLDNTLTGNEGANLLDGGSGGDQLRGGSGDDTYVVDDARDVVTEWLASGNDTVLAGIDYVLPEHLENLRLTGNALSGAGNVLDNMVTGNALGNLLDGAQGADRMAGGGGDDTYIVDNTGDTTLEQDQQGTDHAIASVSYGLAEAVENLTLVGSADLSATGNALDNVITGNAGSNLIDGGAGADAMAGGAGGDHYVVDDVADTVAEAEGEGTDLIEASVGYTLSDNVETLVLTGTAVAGTGNALDNLLVGNAMDNFLDGAAGADRMAGGAGDDTYTADNAGDTVMEAAGEGIDTVRASVTFALGDNVDNLVLTGGNDLDGTGNELDNVIVANSGDNALDGGLGDDVYVYEAGGGLDCITDVGGVDTVRFGAGLSLDNVALRVVFAGDQKIAQVRVLDTHGNEMPDQGLDYAMLSDAQNRMTSPIEGFVFSDGSRYEWHELQIQSTSLTGTSGSDILIGGRHDDSMDGARGNDAMYGGSGHDTMLGGDGSDILYGFGGTDRLYGGHDSDELYGEGGDDQLYGENGDDYLLDRKGSNVFYGGNHNDVLQAGAGADRLDGGNEADLLDAGGGNDDVLGGSGNDWIAGGQGDDTIHSGAGRNLVAFNRGDGADTLVSSGKDVLSLGGGIRYDDLRLTKSGNDLIVGVGEGERISLKDWYFGATTKPVDTLQVITTGGDYDASSADKTRNREVEVFDFTRIVQSFDAACAANAADANGWSLMNSLLDAHLQGSDAAALGGDLSFQYGAAGSLAGIGLGAAQAGLSAGSTSWQSLKPRSELEAGVVRLS